MRSFVRAFWGEIGGNPITNLWFERVKKDIKSIISNNVNDPFITYVMGTENFNMLSDMGVKCTMISKDKFIWNNVKRFYMNKIECIKMALEDFDEIVYLDWDCVQLKPLPQDFWQEFSKKKEIQCPIYKCPRQVVSWRTGRINRKILAGGCFVYIRNKNIINRILEIEKNEEIGAKWTDETYWTKYIDENIGGVFDYATEKGLKAYAEKYEPKWCQLQHGLVRHEDPIFYHPIKGK